MSQPEKTLGHLATDPSPLKLRMEDQKAQPGVAIARVGPEQIQEPRDPARFPLRDHEEKAALPLPAIPEFGFQGFPGSFACESRERGVGQENRPQLGMILGADGAHFETAGFEARILHRGYQPSRYAKIRGATMVASLSTMNFGVSIPSLPQVIFSLGTAPL